MIIKSFVHEIETLREFEMTIITDQVKADVAESGVRNGVVYVISMHTTTGITVNESLPCVERDIEILLERLVPKHGDYVHTHMLPSYGACSGNSPGHLKSLLCGNNTVVPIQDGKMLVGKAQDIYFCEFDGLQMRRYTVTVMGE